MERNQLFNAIAIILATSGLVACGGGSSDSTTSTTSSSKTIIGTIDGFGSVYVNGVKYETDSASYDVDDDTTTDQSDLAVGMKVKVEGTINDDGVTGTANSIYYDDDVEGPIDSGSLTSVDAANKSFTVLGMAVQVDANTTVFDDGATFDTLAEGDIVEVSGYFDGAQIVATRIEKQSDTDDEFELKGTVSNYLNAEITLTLQNGETAGPYDASNAESEIAEGTSGQFVEIKLNTSYEVTEIELDDDDLLDGDETDIDLYGVLTGDYIAGFMINGIPLDLSNSPDYEPISLENNLVEGMEVEVEGSLVNGILIVEEIKAEAENEIEIEALVSEVVYTDSLNGTLTLEMGNGERLAVESNNSTLLEDDSSLDSADDGTFSLSELISGSDFVEVEASLNDSSELIANKIKRKDSSSETTLEGPVDDFVSGSSITLLGISYSFDAQTTFQVDDNLPTTDSSVFFSGLDAGDIVEIKDDEPDLIADEVSRDTISN